MGVPVPMVALWLEDVAVRGADPAPKPPLRESAARRRRCRWRHCEEERNDQQREMGTAAAAAVGVDGGCGSRPSPIWPCWLRWDHISRDTADAQ